MQYVVHLNKHISSNRRRKKINFSVGTKSGTLLTNEKAKVAKLSGEIPDEIVQAVDVDLKTL
ncbi:hypothetical protein [Tannockella kyphosi]|uniref:hypothetical protein n=1 Tax=Tannockella kyphosi TaxID=2899121 RepID=UPI002012B4E3|nr:hypothetical protein [Tannockella kyphosi]